METTAPTIAAVAAIAANAKRIETAVATPTAISASDKIESESGIDHRSGSRIAHSSPHTGSTRGSIVAVRKIALNSSLAAGAAITSVLGKGALADDDRAGVIDACARTGSAGGAAARIGGPKRSGSVGAFTAPAAARTTIGCHEAIRQKSEALIVDRTAIRDAAVAAITAIAALPGSIPAVAAGAAVAPGGAVGSERTIIQNQRPQVVDGSPPLGYAVGAIATVATDRLVLAIGPVIAIGSDRGVAGKGAIAGQDGATVIPDRPPVVSLAIHQTQINERQRSAGIDLEKPPGVAAAQCQGDA